MVLPLKVIWEEVSTWFIQFFDSQSENTKYNGSCSGCAKLAGRLADRLDLNNQIRRVFWELQWISWKQKSWIFSWICQYEPWNWFGIGAQWPINPHDFLAYARCFHCRVIRIFLDSSSSAAKYDNPFKANFCFSNCLGYSLQHVF